MVFEDNTPLFELSRFSPENRIRAFKVYAERYFKAAASTKNNNRHDYSQKYIAHAIIYNIIKQPDYESCVFWKDLIEHYIDLGWRITETWHATRALYECIKTHKHPLDVLYVIDPSIPVTMMGFFDGTTMKSKYGLSIKNTKGLVGDMFDSDKDKHLAFTMLSDMYKRSRNITDNMFKAPHLKFIARELLLPESNMFTLEPYTDNYELYEIDRNLIKYASTVENMLFKDQSDKLAWLYSTYLRIKEYAADTDIAPTIKLAKMVKKEFKTRFPNEYKEHVKMEPYMTSAKMSFEHIMLKNKPVMNIELPELSL